VKPALRREPELTILFAVLRRLAIVFLALSWLYNNRAHSAWNKYRCVYVELEGHLGSLG
jgi:hypothetical protein